MINETPLKMNIVQINHTVNSNLENHQKIVNNCENKQLNQTINNIQQVRSHSENVKQQQRTICTSNTEQLNLTTQNAIVNLNGNISTKNKNTDQKEMKTLYNNFNSSTLEISDIKKNNKKVVLSSLKIRTQITKQLEEEIDTIDCESIINEELKKYRRLRTDSFVENSHINQNQFLKLSQSFNLKNQKIDSDFVNQTKASNNSNKKDLITSQQQSILNSQQSKKEKNQLQNQQAYGQNFNNDDKRENNEEINKIEKEYNFIKEKISIQKAFENLGQEISQLNVDCRKIYDKNKKTIQSRKEIYTEQNKRYNTQPLSSDEDQDFQNQDCKHTKINSSSQRQEIGVRDFVSEIQKKSYSEFKNKSVDCNNKEDLINIYKAKIYNPEDKKQNLNKTNTIIIQKKKLQDDLTSNNFAIFKNQYLQKMQSQQTVKKDFPKHDLTSCLNDDTSSSKQSWDLSTQKNSYESDETLTQNNKTIIQLLLPNSSQMDKHLQSNFQENMRLDEQQLSPNRYYTVQKHKDYIDKSCDTFLNKKSNNPYIPSFSFGMNGFLNANLTINSQTNYQSNSQKNQSTEKSGCSKKIRSITPAVVSNGQKPQQETQEQNKYHILDNTQTYLQRNVNINNKSYNQRQSLNSSSLKKRDNSQTFIDQDSRKNSYVINNSNKTMYQQKLNPQQNNNQQIKNEIGSINSFRQKLICKVVNDIFANKLSQKESEIGDSKNNTFQIRRINHQRLKNDSLNNSMQHTNASNTFIQNNNISVNGKLSILNIDNKDLKQNHDMMISANITTNQEKLNTLLKKKYKYSISRRNKSNILQDKLDCQKKMYTVDNDLTYSIKNLMYSPSIISTDRIVPNHFVQTENQFLKV